MPDRPYYDSLLMTIRRPRGGRLITDRPYYGMTETAPHASAPRPNQRNPQQTPTANKNAPPATIRHKPLHPQPAPSHPARLTPAHAPSHACRGNVHVRPCLQGVRTGASAASLSGQL